MTPPSRQRQLRRAVQLACLFGFLALFVATEYRGRDEIPWPVGLLFRIDPLALVADLCAPGAPHLALLWPALLVLVATALFGRVFCGWICPLGTTLDGCGAVLGRGQTPSRPAWRRVKYLLLFTLTAAALCGVQLIGLFDPLAIFLRTLTLAFYPVYNLAANAVFDLAWDHPLPLVSPAVNALYPFWRDHLMAFHQPLFDLGLLTLLVFLVIVLLERIERRFWCRNLCPLGALLGLCSGASLLRRRPAGVCGGATGDCRRCADDCRMAATASDGLQAAECIRCLDCVADCPESRVAFVWGRRPLAGRGVDLTRRGVVGALAAGVMIAPTIRSAPAAARENEYLLRPPGACGEEEFLRHCVRCGECMKVCIGGALQPALHQAGLAGVWTPLLVARHGYCEYNCTLCGQVCPTGAIRRLPVEEKRKVVVGLAVFDKNRCLPYARGEECLVCEEHCPTGKKAIVFTEQEVAFKGGTRRLKVPRVEKELCIGCGICETKCPLDGVSAIRVVNEGETRHRGETAERY